MAQPTVTSNYVGDVLDYIIHETIVGNEAVESGSIYVMEDVPYKQNIGKLTSSTLPIIGREAMPTTNSATLTWSEATLTPAEMMIFVSDINPRIFESTWRPFQPKGKLPDKVLNPLIQRAIVDAVMDQAKFQMGKMIWQGDTTAASSGRLNFFNGFATRAAASSTNTDVTNQGTITQSNVISILEACVAAIPDAFFGNPNYVLHMSTTDFRKYQAADRALTVKGSETYGGAQKMYGGVEIRHYSQFPANKIIGCMSTTKPNSNLYMAVDRSSDMENFTIEKLRPEGELYFMKALFKADVNFSIDSESIYYAGS